MDGSSHYSPRAIEQIFRDFKARRNALIKALTTEVDEFYQKCDPERENLCLYGHPHERWEVTVPAEEVPAELPEPVLGINFARDGMREKEWLALVAVHSDTWLLAVAHYNGARFGIDKADRKRVFDLILDLPTIFEVVTGSANAQSKGSSSSSSKKTKSKSKGKKKVSQPKYEEDDEEDEDSVDEEEDDQEDTQCGACDESYSANEFWICCDICEKWYHGRCVKITPARAEHIKQYKCPVCCNKRGRA